jgi:hypothetical protein
MFFRASRFFPVQTTNIDVFLQMPTRVRITWWEDVECEAWLEAPWKANEAGEMGDLDFGGREFGWWGLAPSSLPLIRPAGLSATSDVGGGWDKPTFEIDAACGVCAVGAILGTLLSRRSRDLAIA